MSSREARLKVVRRPAAVATQPLRRQVAQAASQRACSAGNAASRPRSCSCPARRTVPSSSASTCAGYDSSIKTRCAVIKCKGFVGQQAAGSIQQGSVLVSRAWCGHTYPGVAAPQDAVQRQTRLLQLQPCRLTAALQRPQQRSWHVVADPGAPSPCHCEHPATKSGAAVCKNQARTASQILATAAAGRASARQRCSCASRLQAASACSSKWGSDSDRSMSYGCCGLRGSHR